MTAIASLWIGDLTEYMDENFLSAACASLGEYGVRGVKIIRQKFTGKSMGYGFLQFADEAGAMETLTRLQGKVIPNSNPPVRFKLNHGVYKKSTEREFSLWVGDIDKDVAEDELYRAFSGRYNSIRTARILRVPTGQSKGYGFVRFANEEEYKDALVTMNGYRGLGTRPIKVSPAIPRKETTEYGSSADGQSATHPPTTATGGSAPAVDYSYYNYDPHASYWGNATGWENYGAMADAYYGSSATDPHHQYRYDAAAAAGAVHQSGYDSGSAVGGGSAAPSALAASVDDDAYDEYALIEHTLPVDIEQMDRDMMEKSNEFYDSLSNSRWLAPEFKDLYEQIALKEI